MKETELRTMTTCAACGKKIGQLALPIFWKVTVERHMLHINNVRSQQGLTMMLGGHSQLAAVMGPDADMTVPMQEPATFMICDPCSLERCVSVAELAEMAKKEGDEG